MSSVSDLETQAVHAAWMALPHSSPPELHDVAEALRAAQAVYDAEREAYVQREVDEARGELARFKETAERFGDPTVTDRIARLIADAPCRCADCWNGQPCNRCRARAVVDAIRAEHLVVLTVEAADQIITHAKESR